MKSRPLFIFLLSTTAIVMFLGPYSLIRDFLQLEKQSLCACDKCLQEDPLLPKSHFNTSIQPLLSAKHKLSEDAFNWWKHIQNEKRNFDTYKATVGKLFEIFPPSPSLTEPSPDRCRTCAVVGNSIHLKGSHYGPLIDFQDFILRMNHAHIKGFEADVGNRTTHRVMYPESAVDLDNTTHLVLLPFKILDLEWLIKAFTTGFSGVSFYFITVMVVNPAFMRYVHDMWLEKKGSYPSTGFMAFILALHICDEGGPCGVLASIQAFVLKKLFENLKSSDTGLQYVILQSLNS